MQRDDLTGLGNAFHRDNLESILQRGILSHDGAARIPHRSIADPEVNDRRAGITVPPSGRRLHSYANLYVNPRNIVLYRFIKDNANDEQICVVKVSLDVLDLPDVIVTDKNAAALPRWMAPDDGLAVINRSDVFATYWKDRDHAQRMCAEVLVPDRVDLGYITEVYVSCKAAHDDVKPVCGRIPVRVKGSLFFR